MTCRLTIIALLLGLAWPGLPAAQTQGQGLNLARTFVDRIVRVTGRQLAGQPGESGYGIVVGERSGVQGGTTLIVVAPDHLVRDPQRPDAAFEPPSVIFMADPTRPVRAVLLEQRLAPEAGDLAVIAVPRPPTFRARPVPAANAAQLVAGAPAWQVGRATDWTPGATPGRFIERDAAGWLTFAGLDNTPGAAGAPVTTEQGIAGMLVGPAGADRKAARVVPVEVIATRLRAWTLPFEFAAPQGLAPIVAGRLGADPDAGRARAAPAGPSDDLPKGLVMLLPAEAAARSSWIPAGARVSPWPTRPVRLYGAARPGSPQIGVLPPGRALPIVLLNEGAYQIGRKLDGGAWFLLEVGGQPIGYAAGDDVIEIWPIQGTSGLAGGKVVHEWQVADGRTAVLRDTGNAFELETAFTCKAVFCDSAVVFTPAPPVSGATVPTFQAPPLTGSWKEGDIVSLRLQLPRRIVEDKDTKLLVCVGHDGDCAMQMLLPAP